jgi:hypothetical protein
VQPQSLLLRTEQPSARPHESLSGLIERVTFFNEENGWAVLKVKAKGHRDLVAVVGSLASVSAGEWVTAEGRWVQDKEFGLQFRADMLNNTAPNTKEGIEKYLGSGMVKGIGPIYAKKLVATFGERIFDIIEQESARLEDVDGIGPKRRQRIKDAWAEQKVRAALTSGWAKKSTKAASSACPKPVGNRSRASQNCSMAGEAISTAALTIRWRNGPSCVMDYLPVKNGVRPCWKVCTSVVRSRYLLPCSQEVSGENRQAWQAAPCKDRPLRQG